MESPTHGRHVDDNGNTSWVKFVRLATSSKFHVTAAPSCRPPPSSQGNRNKAGPTVKELQVDGIRGTLNTEGSLTFSPPCSIRIEFPVRFPQPVRATDCRFELLQLS